MINRYNKEFMMTEIKNNSLANDYFSTIENWLKKLFKITLIIQLFVLTAAFLFDVYSIYLLFPTLVYIAIKFSVLLILLVPFATLDSSINE